MRYCEPLESRRLFTVVVQEEYPGKFRVEGDDYANTVVVEVDQTVPAVTIDGIVYVGSQLPLSQVAFYLDGGNDDITITNLGPTNVVSFAAELGAGDDVIHSYLDGSVWGEAGDDDLYIYNNYRGTLKGGTGTDYILLGGQCLENQIEGGDGNDTIWAVDNGGPVVIYGQGGDDWLYGSAYNDYVFGGYGNDRLFGLGGNDELNDNDGQFGYFYGGTGMDQVICDTVAECNESIFSDVETIIRVLANNP